MWSSLTSLEKTYGATAFFTKNQLSSSIREGHVIFLTIKIINRFPIIKCSQIFYKFSIIKERNRVEERAEKSGRLIMVLSCGMTTPHRFWHIGSRQNHYKSLANRVVCSQYRSAFRSCWGSRPSRWLAVNLTEQYAAISIHTRPRSSWWEDWSRVLIKSGLVVTTLMADALRWVILSNNICDTDWIPLQFLPRYLN